MWVWVGTEASVASKGVVMESVHAMPKRLRGVCEQASFDSILVLGGSNDLW